MKESSWVSISQSSLLAGKDKTPKLEFYFFVLLGQQNSWTIHPCDRRKAFINISYCCLFKKFKSGYWFYVIFFFFCSRTTVHYEYCTVTHVNGSASFFKGALGGDTWKPNPANKVHFVMCGHLQISQLGKDRRDYLAQCSAFWKYPPHAWHCDPALRDLACSAAATAASVRRLEAGSRGNVPPVLPWLMALHKSLVLIWHPKGHLWKLEMIFCEG